MKSLMVCIPMLLAMNGFAQGKFAPPEMKTLIGKTFNNEAEVPGLGGYQSRGGTLITALDDPEPLSVIWLSNSNSILVFFEQLEAGEKLTIIDILEIKNTTANQEIKAGECKDGLNENMGFVALVETSSAKREL
jgi:hypothetical protein